VTLLSIFANHAIAVPLCTTYPDNELRYVVENSDAMVLLASERFREKALDVVKSGVVRKPIVAVEKIEEGTKSGKSITLEDLTSDEGGMMLYTSGTTSRPVSLQRISLTRWKGEPELTSEYRKAWSFPNPSSPHNRVPSSKRGITARKTAYSTFFHSTTSTAPSTRSSPRSTQAQQ